MRGILVLSALLAWVMFQVPMVLCHSPCGQTVGALFCMEGHACHDEESDAHHRHCCEEPGDEDHDEGSDSNDEDGEHLLITLTSPTTPAALELPAASCGVADFAPPAEALSASTAAASRTLVSRDVGPPPDWDPVSTADRLLI